MSKNEFINEYFEWLLDIIRDEKHFDRKSYRKLLVLLHSTDFIYTINMDSNRAEDGKELRLRFGNDIGASDFTLESYLNGPCSVLEMMVALALRCEETITGDSETEDRTAFWFWDMVKSLGLSSSDDKHFSKRFAEAVLHDFLYRDYAANGKGGLFTVNNRECNLSEIEIWWQMCWYLDNILDISM